LSECQKRVGLARVTVNANQSAAWTLSGKPATIRAGGRPPAEFDICEEGQYYINLPNLFVYARTSIVKKTVKI